MMSVDGENQRRLSEGLGSLFAPSMSPDGQSIILAAFRAGSQSIWKMDLEDFEAIPLTDESSEDIDPVWSPDGTEIAFYSIREGERGHCIMKADGSDVRMLRTDLNDIGGRRDWSPDGQWLAFYAGQKGDRDIYKISVDDLELRRLTAGGDNAAPSFSPDGQWIAFMSNRDGDAEIFIMRADGTDVSQLNATGTTAKARKTCVIYKR